MRFYKKTSQSQPQRKSNFQFAMGRLNRRQRRTAVPKLSGTRGRVSGRQFFHGVEWGGRWFQDDPGASHSSSPPAVRPPGPDRPGGWGPWRTRKGERRDQEKVAGLGEPPVPDWWGHRSCWGGAPRTGEHANEGRAPCLPRADARRLRADAHRGSARRWRSAGRAPQKAIASPSPEEDGGEPGRQTHSLPNPPESQTTKRHPRSRKAGSSGTLGRGPPPDQPHRAGPAAARPHLAASQHRGPALGSPPPPPPPPRRRKTPEPAQRGERTLPHSPSSGGCFAENTPEQRCDRT